MIKTFAQLTDNEKAMARRIARSDAARIALEVLIVTNPETGSKFIESDTRGLDAEKLIEIHESVDVVDLTYLLSAIFADDVLRPQFQALVQALSRDRNYDVHTEVPADTEVVTLPVQ
jgi:hypothetical protein